MKNIKHKLKVGALCVMSLVAPKMVTAETVKPKMYKFSMVVPFGKFLNNDSLFIAGGKDTCKVNNIDTVYNEQGGIAKLVIDTDRLNYECSYFGPRYAYGFWLPPRVHGDTVYDDLCEEVMCLKKQYYEYQNNKQYDMRDSIELEFNKAQDALCCWAINTYNQTSSNIVQR